MTGAELAKQALVNLVSAGIDLAVRQCPSNTTPWLVQMGAVVELASAQMGAQVRHVTRQFPWVQVVQAKLLKAGGVDELSVLTDEDYVQAVVKFFRLRALRRAKG